MTRSDKEKLPAGIENGPRTPVMVNALPPSLQPYQKLFSAVSDDDPEKFLKACRQGNFDLRDLLAGRGFLRIAIMAQSRRVIDWILGLDGFDISHFLTSDGQPLRIAIDTDQFATAAYFIARGAEISPEDMRMVIAKQYAPLIDFLFSHEKFHFHKFNIFDRYLLLEEAIETEQFPLAEKLLGMGVEANKRCLFALYQKANAHADRYGRYQAMAAKILDTGVKPEGDWMQRGYTPQAKALYRWMKHYPLLKTLRTHIKNNTLHSLLFDINGQPTKIFRQLEKEGMMPHIFDQQYWPQNRYTQAVALHARIAEHIQNPKRRQVFDGIDLAPFRREAYDEQGAPPDQWRERYHVRKAQTPKTQL